MTAKSGLQSLLSSRWKRVRDAHATSQTRPAINLQILISNVYPFASCAAASTPADPTAPAAVYPLLSFARVLSESVTIIMPCITRLAVLGALVIALVSAESAYFFKATPCCREAWGNEWMGKPGASGFRAADLGRCPAHELEKCKSPFIAVVSKMTGDCARWLEQVLRSHPWYLPVLAAMVVGALWHKIRLRFTGDNNRNDDRNDESIVQLLGLFISAGCQLFGFWFCVHLLQYNGAKQPIPINLLPLAIMAPEAMHLWRAWQRRDDLIREIWRSGWMGAAFVAMVTVNTNTWEDNEHIKMVCKFFACIAVLAYGTTAIPGLGLATSANVQLIWFAVCFVIGLSLPLVDVTFKKFEVF